MNAVPKRILGDDLVTGVEFDVDGETMTLEADVVFKAVTRDRLFIESWVVT